MRQTRWLEHRIFLAALGCLVLAVPARQAASADSWTFESAGRVVAIGDIHGAYDALVQTLKEADLIDTEGHWAGADAQLVFTGDLLDRGPASRAVMDLLMRLEDEAPPAGGQVHIVLGNHEVMNLVGDLRYVSAADYAAFTDEETPELRDRWFQHFSEQQLMPASDDALREAFDQSRPPGFYGHAEAFAPDGKYGKWLLSKPLLIVVNGTAFVHGGLSPAVGELGLEGVNGQLKAQVIDYVQAANTLAGAGVLDPAINFYNRPAALQALPADPDRPPAITASIETVMQLSSAAIHGLDSPIWYRGNVACPEIVEIDRIDPVLESIGASRVVIGHTPTLDRQVHSRLDGRVIEIDTGMLNGYYQGSGHALLQIGDALEVIAQDGQVAAGVAEQPRWVGLFAGNPDRSELESVLGNAQLLAGTTSAREPSMLQLSGPNGPIDALFHPYSERETFLPDLAAYQLDLFLGLNMVPVTVARKLNGQYGVLQAVPGATTTESERVERQAGASAWCPLTDQWGAMYVFDALIDNAGRTRDKMIYSQEGWQMMLVGNDTTFGTDRSRPAYLAKVDLALGPQWQKKLAELDDDRIDELLSEVLDQRRRRALEQRRDGLLKDAR